MKELLTNIINKIQQIAEKLGLIATAYGSVYFARLWDSLPLPSGLFITAPTSAIEIFDSYADCWPTKRVITSEEIGVASLLCPTTGSRHGVASISCKGRWK